MERLKAVGGFLFFMVVSAAAVAMLFSLVGPRASAERVIAARVDQNSAIAREGIEGLRCLLSLPPAGTPGGRTDADIKECFREYGVLVGERTK